MSGSLMVSWSLILSFRALLRFAPSLGRSGQTKRPVTTQNEGLKDHRILLHLSLVRTKSTKSPKIRKSTSLTHVPILAWQRVSRGSSSI